MVTLDEIVSRRPSFHASETEVQRSFASSESLLPVKVGDRVASSGLTCYGLGEEALRFLGENVREGSHTLETGAGCSTLVFALRGTKHTAVTPSTGEIQRIRDYAASTDIPLCGVDFVAEASEHYLPRCPVRELDLVLLDGKHAFPWPMIDWFFTADRLSLNGLMILDDAQMRSVAVLADFMSMDPHWRLLRNFSDRTLVFEKRMHPALDVAWHMQPWTVTEHYTAQPGMIRSAYSRLRRRWAS